MSDDGFPDETFEQAVIRKLTEIKVQTACLPDHEKRLRWLERMAYGIWGAWGLVTTWLGIHVSKH